MSESSESSETSELSKPSTKIEGQNKEEIIKNFIYYINNKKEEEEDDKICGEIKNSNKYLKYFVISTNFFGEIMRFFFQIGEFYVCIVILNIFFEIVIIFFGSGTTSDHYILHIYRIFFSFILSYLLINPITFVFYELIQFNWILQINPFFTIFEILSFWKFKCDCKINKYFIEFIINLFLFCFMVILIILLFVNSNIYQKVLTYVIIYLNLAKYIIIFFLYLMDSLNAIINIYLIDFVNCITNCFGKEIKFPECCDVIKFDNKIPINPFIYSILYLNYVHIYDKNNNDIEDKALLSIINALSEKGDNPIKSFIFKFPIPYLSYFIKKEISNKIFFLNNKPEHKEYSTIIKLKIIMFFFILLVTIIYFRDTIDLHLYIIFLFIFILAFPIQLEPFSFLYEKDNKLNLYNIINKFCKGFKLINVLCSILFYLFPIIFSIISLFAMVEKNGFSDIEKSFNKTGLFIPKNFVNEVNNDNYHLKSAMCLTNFYKINLVKFASLAQIIYFNNTEKIKFYLDNSIFSGNDNIKISDIKLISKENAMLMMIDIDIKNQKGVRVFAVRGTKALKDIILDAEMFSSSAMLSLIRLLPLIGNTESFFSKNI